MKTRLLFLYFLIPYSLLFGQQLPFFTQYMTSSFLWNPAVAGTKKDLDLRTAYRNQWVGFEGAPETEYISINSRLSGGKFGAGAFVYKDDTGPTSRMNYSGTVSAHLRFPDVEASFGLTGSLVQYSFRGEKVTIQDPADPAFNQTITQKTNVPDLGFGLYLYNDRFHVGLSAMSLVRSEINFHVNSTSDIYPATLAPHLYFSFGYNFSGNPDYVWENSFYVNYVRSSPITLGYSLRLFYKNKLITGASIRTADAIALHLGFIIAESIQVCYSYDFITSNIRKHNNGSHEILVAYSVGFQKKRRSKNDAFQRNKYKYMF